MPTYLFTLQTMVPATCGIYAAANSAGDALKIAQKMIEEGGAVTWTPMRCKPKAEEISYVSHKEVKKEPVEEGYTVYNLANAIMGLPAAVLNKKLKSVFITENADINNLSVQDEKDGTAIYGVNK